MAFSRQGKVTFPHRKHETVTLTRSDGSPVTIPLGEIRWWNEYLVPKSLARPVVVYWGLNATAVQQTYEEVCTLVNGKAVQP